MWKVSGSVAVDELERAMRAQIATPDRRERDRERLDGIAEIVSATSGLRARGITVDLGEGGFSLLTSLCPEVGEQLRIELSGLVFEGRVRNIAADGDSFRVGVQAD